MGRLAPPMPCEACGRPIAQALPICPLCGHRRAGFVPKEVRESPPPDKPVDGPRELPREARAQLILLAHEARLERRSEARRLDALATVLRVLTWPAIGLGLLCTFPLARRAGRVDSFWTLAAGALVLVVLGLRLGGVGLVACLVPVVAWPARLVVQAVVDGRRVP